MDSNSFINYYVYNNQSEIRGKINMKFKDFEICTL